MREEYKWKSCLRIGREPSVDIINRGLKEFILSHNNLGETFMRSMSERIKTDDYLRFIDLRYNKLKSAQIISFLKTIDQNKCLMGLDLRGNLGYAENEDVKMLLSHYL
jgi:hypothetical protein